MKKDRTNFYILIVAGCISISISRYVNLGWGDGMLTAIWIMAFLSLTSDFRDKKELIFSGVAFCLGFFLKFAGSSGAILLDAALFGLMGLMVFALFLIYGAALNRWNRWWITPLFPAMYMVMYSALTSMRLPSLVRIDVMFTNQNLIIQSEKVLGSFALSFLILWMLSLVHHSFRSRRNHSVVVAFIILIGIMLTSIYVLFPNRADSNTVRIAYSTGPYGGDFVDYKAPSLDESIASIEKSAESAADADAAILVFNEETVELKDNQEEEFLEKCRDIARSNNINMLVGMDMADTDNSLGGKSENKITWIDSKGEIQDSYTKTQLIPVIESGYEPGDGNIPSRTIRINGRDVKISYAICYDSNFPEYISQMDDDTDILLLPSWDWGAVTHLHSKLCTAIAIENRVNILKPTYDGLSVALNADGKVIYSSDTANTGFESLQVVNLPASGGTDAAMVYPDKMHYIYAIIASEIFALLICLILLYGTQFEGGGSSPKNRLYALLVTTVMLANAMDALSWITDGSTRLESVSFASTTLSMIMTFIIAAEFASYLYETINQTRRIAQAPKNIYVIICAALVVITAIGCFNNSLIYFNNGVYHDGKHYAAYVVANLLTMVFCTALLIFYRQAITLHQALAGFTYIAIPVAAGFINFFYEEMSFTYPAITLSLAVIYVMLQSERAGRLESEKRISMYYANHDPLTTLYNRRACDMKIEELKAEKTTFGVIFGDVNGLKYTNDTLGHADGDKLLIRFANMLAGSFRKEEIYRISGDEFLVLLPGLAYEAFNYRFQEFEDMVNMDDIPIACVASAYGTTDQINDMINKAETKMYIKKQAFHKIHPELSR